MRDRWVTDIQSAELPGTVMVQFHLMPSDATAVAERRIAHVAATGATELNLVDLGLSRLPDSLARLTHLQRLDLSRNRLTALSDVLANLTQLRALDVTANQLTVLPDALGALRGLQSLMLWNNQLTALPETMTDLVQLQHVSLRNNHLTALPDGIANLVRLQWLDVSFNKLTALPEDLGKLASLQHLMVGGNALAALPDSLAGLTQLRLLGAELNQLTTLPAGLTELGQLNTLDLADNRLTAFPDKLSRLARLEHLRVSRNQLANLPDGTADLVQLRYLAVEGNRLTALPGRLANLVRLGVLVAADNQLSRLPEGLGRLASLTKLDLAGNRLTALATELSPLVRLRYLDIARNLFTVLPDDLGSLTALETLNLSENALTRLPDGVGNLAQLEYLNVAGNRLTALPESMTNLSRVAMFFLHGNPDLALPTEILGPTWQDVEKGRRPESAASILDYYFRTVRGAQALNEAKLILVGRGGVGKTSLRRRLVAGQFDADERETPGIEIQQWVVNVPSGADVRLHIWDFGGQEILHATHQFFLTERTLYLLVLAGREGGAMPDAEYWLQLIRSFGGDSRVLIVLNKSSAHRFDLDRGLLLTKYPFIVGVIATDCADGTGIADLKEQILRYTDELDHRRTKFPAEWFAIKERLATMKDNFIAWEAYQDVCRELGETDPAAQRELAGFLHVLGIALNYRDDPRLKDTHVLNPHWVTDGIYSVLRASQRTNVGGILTKADLGQALDARRYPADTHDFLLRLMEKFELCFRLGGRAERYLVPELLSEAGVGVDPTPPDLGFRYEYEYALPEGLLPRFIVQTHAMSEKTPRWRTGVVLERDRCRAVVRADRDKRTVGISVHGPPNLRRSLLAIIREKFDAIHSDFSGLPVQQRVPLPDEPDLTVSYEHLLILEDEAEEWVRPERSKKRYRVADLLNGVESAADRQQRRWENLAAGHDPNAYVPRRRNALAAEQNDTRGGEMPAKCRLLFLAANPSGTSQLALDRESREMDQKIRASDHRDSLDLITKWAIRPDDLLQYLNQFRPHIVHFSGHGDATEEIILHDSRELAKPVSKAALKQLLRTMKDNIRVVVLNACFSRPQAEAITEVVDCAIGMKRAIGDNAAITFSASFYRAIGFGRSVQEAFDQGIAALMLEDIPEDTTPELLVKDGVDANAIYLVGTGPRAPT
ncbi:CHAT domain-containing protein [Vineibacter terrae]|uniref:non-specific serine/threonine protein kinase n=1 Tax=Vineibacter terrae TaxID=2586908 RepID=A0A5C8PVA6_9HYPH|nr:CHAT domain-containing protein [Vineibacter terrae]